MQICKYPAFCMRLIVFQTGLDVLIQITKVIDLTQTRNIVQVIISIIVA